MGSKAPERPTAEQMAAKPILPPPTPPKRLNAMPGCVTAINVRKAEEAYYRSLRRAGRTVRKFAEQLRAMDAGRKAPMLGEGI